MTTTTGTLSHDQMSDCNYLPVSRLAENDCRIAAKVRVDEETGCWIWTGCDRNGYGRLTRQGRGHSVHRYVYEMLVGPIAAGLELDHLCRRPPCCNPAHLEPVTPQENLRRAHPIQTHCQRGHIYDDTNTYLYDGRRYCRPCRRINVAEWRAARAAVTA